MKRTAARRIVVTATTPAPKAIGVSAHCWFGKAHKESVVVLARSLRSFAFSTTPPSDQSIAATSNRFTAMSTSAAASAVPGCDVLKDAANQSPNQVSLHWKIEYAEDADTLPRTDTTTTATTTIGLQSIPWNEHNALPFQGVSHNRAASEATTETTDEMLESVVTIPESVLRYERQMRKAQQARKLSLPLASDALQIVYHDSDIVVVNKPPDVLTVPGIHSRSCVLDLVHDRFGEAVQDKAHMIVHRLDMATSGIVLFGRTLNITKRMQAIFRDRLVLKTYQALLMGHFPIDKGTIDLPLQRDHAYPPFMRISTPTSEADAVQAVKDLQQHGWKKLIRKKPKPSQTSFRVLARSFRNGLPFTRMELVPVTGRTHQLRVHCAALGYPIVGDPTYGLYGEAALYGGLVHAPVSISGNADETDAHRIRASRPGLQMLQAWTDEYVPNEKAMCLHAALLQCEHPTTGMPIVFEASPDF